MHNCDAPDTESANPAHCTPPLHRRKDHVHTIVALFTHLSPLVHWPERHCLQGNVPHQFIEASSNRVEVIMDCFEITIWRASNLQARAQTFSHHKLKQAHGKVSHWHYTTGSYRFHF